MSQTLMWELTCPRTSVRFLFETRAEAIAERHEEAYGPTRGKPCKSCRVKRVHVTLEEMQQEGLR